MSSIDKSLPVSCSRLGAALSLALSRYLACARARQQPSSSDVSVHEALVEVRPEEVLGYVSRETCCFVGGWRLAAHVDELFLLVLVLGASCLVLEDDVVVPPALDVEVGLVEQRVAQRNVPLPGVLLGRRLFAFLRPVSPETVDWGASRPAASLTSLSRFSARSRLIFSSSLCSSAVSSSSSLSSSLLPASSSSSESSASMSLVSSKMRRRFASGSSSLSSS